MPPDQDSWIEKGKLGCFRQERWEYCENEGNAVHNIFKKLKTKEKLRLKALVIQQLVNLLVSMSAVKLISGLN